MASIYALHRLWAIGNGSPATANGRAPETFADAFRGSARNWRHRTIGAEPNVRIETVRPPHDGADDLMFVVTMAVASR